LLGVDAKGSVIIKPTLLITEPMTLDLGDRQLRLTPYTNAHTNTDISVIDSKTQTLFTGDLLFIERTPVLEGDIKNFIATIDTLKNYPVKQVVPGHGPVAKEWQQAFDNEKRYFNAVLTDIRQIIDQDGSMREAMDKAAASEKDKWLLFDIANRRNVNMVYPALEWE
jgi:glyoxylase-like metal-dependent hydrolase (beta-lactamase superfamily II)